MVHWGIRNSEDEWSWPNQRNQRNTTHRVSGATSLPPADDADLGTEPASRLGPHPTCSFPSYDPLGKLEARHTSHGLTWIAESDCIA